jgi:drug/metabolite transporter (DMT)-like permease
MLAMWSVNYLAGKIALGHMDPVTLVAFRFEVAAVIMLAVYFAQKGRMPLRKGAIWTFTYLSFLGVVLNQGLFTLGLNYTTSSHSAIIVAIDPILILILARALKIERLTAGKISGMALAFVGILVLEMENGPRSPLLMGDLISLGGALGFSFYAVFAKPITQEYDAIALNTFNCVAAAILFLPVAIRQGIHLDWKSVGWIGWSGMFYMAIFSSVTAYLLFYWVLRYMDPSRVAAINYLQPVCVVVLASFFLSERPSSHLLGGTGLVLAGVWLAERGAAREAIGAG